MRKFLTKRAVRKTLRIAIESIPPADQWGMAERYPEVDWERHVGKYLHR